MSKRPVYGGIPSHVEAEISARRQRAENVQAVAPSPPAPAPSPSIPVSVEQRLKAVEKAIAALDEKLDLVLDVLTHGEKPGADLFGHAPKTKRPKP